MANLRDKFLGAMYGLAIGDALGFPVEFLGLEEIREKFGPEGVTDFIKMFNELPLGAYSDDTQMTLATANGLITAGHLDLDRRMDAITDEYISWRFSPENNRAPGTTCTTGVDNMNDGIHWSMSGIPDSDGCGAAMRTAAIGLYFLSLSDIRKTAYAASKCTHAGEADIMAGIATAYLTSRALMNEEPSKMVEGLIKLGRSGIGHSDEFVEQIEQVKGVLDYKNTDNAINELGQGWNGKEAVAIGLYCFLKNPENYEKTVLMAANTDGDSDSLASIAGAISGAYNGINGIPQEWITNVENSPLIWETANKLYDSSKHNI